MTAFADYKPRYRVKGVHVNSVEVFIYVAGIIINIAVVSRQGLTSFLAPSI